MSKRRRRAPFLHEALTQCGGQEHFSAGKFQRHLAAERGIVGKKHDAKAPLTHGAANHEAAKDRVFSQIDAERAGIVVSIAADPQRVDQVDERMARSFPASLWFRVT